MNMSRRLESKLSEILSILKLCLFHARKESKIIGQASMIYTFDSAFFYLALTLLGYVTFSTYAGAGNSLNPRKVFTALTLFALLRWYCVQFVNIALLGFSEFYVAYKRIKVSIHKPTK